MSSRFVPVRRPLWIAALSGLLLGTSFVVGGVSAEPAAGTPPEVSPAVRHDVSPPLRGMVPASPTGRQLTERPLRLIGQGGPQLPDGALQATVGANVAATAGLGFAGVGQGDYGFSDRYAPPDTNGAVGATQYVQWVNVDLAVFNKSTGALALGPIPGNTVFQGFGGGCETNNDGDPIVQYDKAAGRWILTQFSVSTTPYLQCVAVSTTSDATGSYYRYAFSYGTTQFPDYPKLGVWPDGYYISYNIFNNGIMFAGSKLCALDRARMLTGAAATQQCFQLSSSFGGVVPSDLDGTTAPPAGTPNLLVNFGSNSLNLWKFQVDWATPGNTTLSGPTNIPVASFTRACNGGTCVPQPGTNETLDSLADRLMYRLAYRHFNDGHEALVVNHSVTAGASAGVRWYELRNASGSTMASATPVVYQQGTYAPDSTYRWMGSAAMDGSGDIAVGYSASSTSVAPSIRYTGRVPSDPLGTLAAETTLKTGTGSQLANLSRWGDYSALTVDPVDDCTFWYTNEYLKASGTFNWSTWISSFRFPGCGAAQTLSSITVSPASASVSAGGTQQFSATGLDQFGQPMSPQPSFAWSVSGGGTISPSGLFTAGSTAGGPFTVTAASGSVSGTANVTVTATAPNFLLSVSPSSQTAQRGTTPTYTVTITPTNGFVGSVSLSVSGQPSGVSASFSPNPTTGISTLSLVLSPNGPRGTYTLTIAGTNGSLTHTTTATLTITRK